MPMLTVIQENVNTFGKANVCALMAADLNAQGAIQAADFDLWTGKTGFGVRRAFAVLKQGGAAAGIPGSAITATLGFNAPNYDDLLASIDLETNVDAAHAIFGTELAERGAKNTTHHILNVGDPMVARLRVVMTGGRDFSDVTDLSLVVAIVWDADIKNWAGI